MYSYIGVWQYQGYTSSWDIICSLWHILLSAIWFYNQPTDRSTDRPSIPMQQTIFLVRLTVTQLVKKFPAFLKP